MRSNRDPSPPRPPASRTTLLVAASAALLAWAGGPGARAAELPRAQDFTAPLALPAAAGVPVEEVLQRALDADPGLKATRLERDAGTPLMSRQGRYVVPTDSGLALVAAARVMISAEERARAELERLTETITGRLAVAHARHQRHRLAEPPSLRDLGLDVADHLVGLHQVAHLLTGDAGDLEQFGVVVLLGDVEQAE